MARNDRQVNIRIPESLKKYLDEQAETSHRSFTAEVVYRLEKNREEELKNEHA